MCNNDGRQLPQVFRELTLSFLFHVNKQYILQHLVQFVFFVISNISIKKHLIKKKDQILIAKVENALEKGLLLCVGFHFDFPPFFVSGLRARF